MIWLIGAQGMLGQEIAKELEEQNLPFLATDLDVDITDVDALRNFAAGRGIGWILNAAAYTAVDKAEHEEDKATAVNAQGPACIGRVAREIDATVIHFSTDYVFDGTKKGSYVETDPVNPVSAYGRTKLAGEIALRQATGKCFIFRISWLYGEHGGNFVATMLRLFKEKKSLGVVADQLGAPTWTKSLAQNIVQLINNQDVSNGDKFGIYHYSDDAFISWYDFAVAIYEEALQCGLLSQQVEIKPINTIDYPTPAQRPANSSFDKTKVQTLGFLVPPWRDNLRTYLNDLV